MNKERLPEQRELHTSEYLKRQERKKPEKVPISKEEFFMTLDDILSFWNDQLVSAQLRIHQIQSVIRRHNLAEALEMKIRYFAVPEEGRVEFEAREKGKFGYRGVVKNNEKPAQKSE